MTVYVYTYSWLTMTDQQATIDRSKRTRQQGGALARHEKVAAIASPALISTIWQQIYNSITKLTNIAQKRMDAVWTEKISNDIDVCWYISYDKHIMCILCIKWSNQNWFYQGHLQALSMVLRHRQVPSMRADGFVPWEAMGNPLNYIIYKWTSSINHLLIH